MMAAPTPAVHGMHDERMWNREWRSDAAGDGRRPGMARAASRRRSRLPWARAILHARMQKEAIARTPRCIIHVNANSAVLLATAC